MKLYQPVGDAEYAGLFVRVPLGVYFIFAGLSKLENPMGFLEEVRKFKVIVQGFSILREPLTTLYGVTLPYIEIGVGALLIVGLWTTLAAIITSLLLLSYILAFGAVVNQKPFTLNKDVLLLGASLSLLYSGAGKLSLDRFRKAGG